MLAAQLLARRDLLREPAVVGVLLRALVFLDRERGNGDRGALVGAPHGEGGTRDAVPRQRRLERALADFLRVDGRGQRHVGLDATVLRALTGHAIELADRDGELPVDGALRPAIEGHEVLHGALAEGALSEYRAAVVVLDGRGEDLR